MHRLLCLYLFLHLVVGAVTYSIPQPTVVALDSEKYRFSIPHENGITLVAFHFNVNKPLGFNQPGDYDVDLREPADGQWFHDFIPRRLEAGGIINYWIHVQYGGFAYRRKGSIQINQTDVPPPNVQTPRPTAPPTQPRPKPTTKPQCEQSKTTVFQKTVCKNQLIFEDNFDELNWNKWKREIRLPIETDDAEFVSYQSRAENCYVNNGQLHIVPNLLSQVPGFNEQNIKSGTLDLSEQCTAPEWCSREAQGKVILPPIISARIRTKESFSFRYGKIEVRAKLPKGDWLFPLILLEPTENYYGSSSYTSGEMRVAFSRGNEILEDRDRNDISGHRIGGGVVLSPLESLRSNWIKTRIQRSHSGDGFHTYTLTWTDSYIAMEIDGNEYDVIRGGFSRLFDTQDLSHAKVWASGEFMAPFDREFFITLGVAAGGHADFPDGILNGRDRKKKPWNNTDPKAELKFWNDRANWHNTWQGENVGLHVDYVRVYAL